MLIKFVNGYNLCFLTCYLLTIITLFFVLAPNRLYKPANEDAVHGSSLAWDLCNEHDFLLVCASGGWACVPPPLTADAIMLRGWQQGTLLTLSLVSSFHSNPHCQVKLSS